MLSSASLDSDINGAGNLGRQADVGYRNRVVSISTMTGPEHGLKSMLQEADDILFVMDPNGALLNCKARMGADLSLYPAPPGKLMIHDVLPPAILNKFEQALRQVRDSSRFVLFEGMLTLPPREISWHEFRLFPALGNQLLMFVWNVNGYKELSRTISNLSFSIQKIIEGWSRALYLRDFETEDHTRRVMNMTVKLARRLGIPEEEIAHIQRGAEVHDIGKLAIPDEILLKAGALTDDEWVLMRKHPLIAMDLLEPISQFAPALTIPRSHHEKWDGSGYPDKLAGEKIPLAARLFAFADVYDALTSDRPYRPAWSRLEALDYIQRHSGSHFDPALTPDFIRMMSD